MPKYSETYKQVRFYFRVYNGDDVVCHDSCIYVYNEINSIEEFIHNKIHSLSIMDFIVYSYSIETVNLTVDKTVILDKGVDQVEIL